ncbi:MAG: hypothetical protein H2041_08235 [Phenylobacterium sp.]|uniref:hypothetical protein n=1 Tax=Phenylobacterium sp. TaxID=1871053 RepID=UPI0017DCB1AA|nr:hypothetical protein [Phenylobacterium sp.]MBA4793638.1 hypothetical protein [Phenylobacterium sp.]
MTFSGKQGVVVQVSRLLARLLGVMLLVVAVASPAVPMDAHAAAHRVSSVDATHHHHHDASGAVVADDHHHRHESGAPADDDKADSDGGHHHLPIGQILFEVAPPPAHFGVIIAATEIKQTIGSERALPDIAPAPPNRPPRSS